MCDLSSDSKILLWGGRSKSRLILHALSKYICASNISIYDSTLNEISFPFIGEHISSFDSLSDRISNFSHFATCIGGGHGYARYTISKLLEDIGLIPLYIKSPNIFICESVKIGKGIQIMPSVTVNSFTTIGDYTVLNTGSLIDHECSIGNGVHIMGSASLAGRITVKDFSSIGTNATILPDITIGKGAFVGAGAVVTKDVDDFTVVAGVPARKMRANKMEINSNEIARLAALAATRSSQTLGSLK